MPPHGPGSHACTAARKVVRLAQNMQVDPCIPLGIQLSKAEVGPTSGPTWRLPHFGREQTRPPQPRQQLVLLDRPVAVFVVDVSVEISELVLVRRKLNQ